MVETSNATVNRQAPLGDEKWQVETATKHGLLATLNASCWLRLMLEGDLGKMWKNSLGFIDM